MQAGNHTQSCRMTLEQSMEGRVREMEGGGCLGELAAALGMAHQKPLSTQWKFEGKEETGIGRYLKRDQRQMQTEMRLAR